MITCVARMSNEIRGLERRQNRGLGKSAPSMALNDGWGKSQLSSLNSIELTLGKMQKGEISTIYWPWSVLNIF